MDIKKKETFILIFLDLALVSLTYSFHSIIWKVYNKERTEA